MWAQEGILWLLNLNTTKADLSAGFGARLDRCSCHRCLALSCFVLTMAYLQPQVLHYKRLCPVLLAATNLSVPSFLFKSDHVGCRILLFPLLYAKSATLDRLCCSDCEAPGPDVWYSCSAGPEVPSQEAVCRKLLLAWVGFLVCGPTASHLVTQAGRWQLNAPGPLSFHSFSQQSCSAITVWTRLDFFLWNGAWRGNFAKHIFDLNINLDWVIAHVKASLHMHRTYGLKIMTYQVMPWWSSGTKLLATIWWVSRIDRIEFYICCMFKWIIPVSIVILLPSFRSQRCLQICERIKIQLCFKINRRGLSGCLFQGKFWVRNGAPTN